MYSNKVGDQRSRIDKQNQRETNKSRYFCETPLHYFITVASFHRIYAGTINSQEHGKKQKDSVRN